MRYYEFMEPLSATDLSAVYIRRSEHEILREYALYWINRMIEAGKPVQAYTLQDIIDDWKAVNWAYEVFPEQKK